MDDEMTYEERLATVEVRCGTCKWWSPWKDFAIPGVRSVRRAIEEGEQTGCDGTCCYYALGHRRGPRDSMDPSAVWCDHYTPVLPRDDKPKRTKKQKK